MGFATIIALDLGKSKTVACIMAAMSALASAVALE